MLDTWALALVDGRLHLEASGLPLVRLHGMRPEVAYRSAGQAHVWSPGLSAESNGFLSQPALHGLRLRIVVDRRDGALVLHTTLRNEGRAPVSVARLAPLAIDATGTCQIGSGVDRWSVLRQGYQSWTGTRSFRARETDRDPISPLLRIGLVDLRRPSPAQPGHFLSDQFTAVKNLRSGEVLVAGLLDIRAAFGGVEVAVSGERCTRFAVSIEYDDVVLEPGAEWIAPPIWLAVGFDEHAALAAYASAVGAAMQARIPARNPVGWCSWYYYFTRITEERIVENLAALTRLRTEFPCDYVQVDDGYQAEIGDWLIPNPKFPRGMGWVAEQIRGAGFDAGIWTAPFIARSGSRLLTEHPDWFVRNAAGRPRFALWNPAWGVRGACYALDTTHPAALDWLRSTFHTIAREWGYRILKLDFLFAAALPGRRHDASATRAAALRRGLDAVREGAGDEAFLLGCGCPLGPAIGVVEAMRIGPDVAPFWSNALSRVACRDLHGLATKNAIRNTLTRAFLHRRWWLNDPDCLMVRDTKTQLTLEEVRSLAAAIAVTDGMIVLSDRVERLSPERRQMLERTLQLAGGEPTAIDLMDADVPELVVARGPQRNVVAAFNFGDAPQRRTIDLAGLGIASGATSVAEWWTGAPVAIADRHADLGEIPPHGCRVIVLPL